MFERYTDEAKRAIFFSRGEALVRKEAVISVKDVLLGLAGEEKSRANQIASLNARDAELRSALGVAPFPEHIDRSVLEPKTSIPLDGDAKKTLAYAAQEADSDRQFWLDTDHLLRGLLWFPNAAADALSKLGVEMENMRTASLQNRKEFPPRRVPVGIKLKATVKKFRPHLLLIAGLLLIFLIIKLQG